MRKLIFCLMVSAVLAAPPGCKSAFGSLVWTPDAGWRRETVDSGAPVDREFDGAFAAFTARDYSKARKRLEKVIGAAVEPTVEDARVLVAECYLADKHYTKAFDKYEEFLKSYPAGRHVDRVCHAQLQIAREVLAGAKIKALGLRIWSGYGLGEKVVDRIVSRRPLSTYAREAQIILARSYFRRGMYIESASAFEQYMELSPQGPEVEEALLGVGHSLHLDAPGPGYDPLPCYKAEAAFTNFARQYEASPGAPAALELLAQVRGRLAEHYLLVGKWYLKKGKLDAAAVYFALVVDRYGETGTAERARILLRSVTQSQ